MIQTRILTRGDEQTLVDAAATFSAAITLEEASAHLKGTAEVYVVALWHNEIVGFLYGYVLPRFRKRVLFIYSVEVAPDARRRGVGTAMLQTLKDREKSGAWSEMFVITNARNEAAMALYRGAGGKRPNDDDVLFDFDLNGCT